MVSIFKKNLEKSKEPLKLYPYFLKIVRNIHHLDKIDAKIMLFLIKNQVS